MLFRSAGLAVGDGVPDVPWGKTRKAGCRGRQPLQTRSHCREAKPSPTSKDARSAPQRRKRHGCASAPAFFLTKSKSVFRFGKENRRNGNEAVELASAAEWSASDSTQGGTAKAVTDEVEKQQENTPHQSPSATASPQGEALFSQLRRQLPLKGKPWRCACTAVDTVGDGVPDVP